MIPDPLRRGIDSLDVLENVEILDHCWQNSQESKYTIHIRISHDVDAPDPRLPKETNWYIVADSKYPAGHIKIYPSSKEGIKKTFAHQMQNRKGKPSHPWRTGNICVGRYEARVGRSADREPYASEKRLLWYTKRSVRWVEDAAKGDLRKSGEFYEVPDFNSSSDDSTLVFNETYESFETWNSQEGYWGKVKLSKLKRPADRLLVKEFLSRDGQTKLRPNIGDYLTDNIDEEINSAWLYLEKPPFQEPWAAPETWKELDEFLDGIPERIYELIGLLSDDLPQGGDRYLLVGFPIPERIGGEPCLIHWQPISIPYIRPPTDRHGSFRDLDKNHSREARIALEPKDVQWLAAENWADEQLSRRGSVSEKLANSKTLLIGAGALGSVIAENLVRMGVRNLIIIDDETFEVGNIARHTLTLNEIGEPKASAVAERLRSLFPHTEIEAINSSFPPKHDHKNQIDDADLVVDCTGEVSILEQLDNYAWLDTVRFSSISMGRRGNRLFAFQAYSNEFPSKRFNKKIQGWMEKEDIERTEDDIVVERVGCWHPASVIPMDKITAWGGVVPSLLEQLMEFKRNDSHFSVLERDQTTISAVEEPFANSTNWNATDSSRTIQILGDCSERMRELCSEASAVETGGILMGKYNEDEQNALVAIADEPAPDSKQTSTMLWRGSEGVNERLAEQRELRGVRYLGEWHYHPNSQPSPSQRDKQTLREIAENDAYDCPEPIMVIIGGDKSGFSKGVYAYHRHAGIEKFEQDG